MSTHCTSTDVAMVFGWNNVTAWSQLENDQSALDDDRMERAIAVASAHIDNMFQGITLPAESVVVTDWAAKLAGIWLFESRFMNASAELVESVERMKIAVQSSMQSYRGYGYPNFTKLPAVGVADNVVSGGDDD